MISGKYKTCSKLEINNVTFLCYSELKITLNEIKDLNIKLNINYYSQKKIESQKKDPLIFELLKAVLI